MWSKTLLLAAVLAIAHVSASAQSTKEIRVATEGAYPPWNYTEAGKLVGFDIELTNDLCARMKVTCSIAAQDFDALIPALNAGKFDVIIAAMNSTPKRREVIGFSQPYAVEPIGLVAPKDSTLATIANTGQRINVAKAADAEKILSDIRAKLKGKILGVQAGTAYAAFVDKYLRDGVDVREYKTVEQLDLDLAAGRVDAIINGIGTIAATLSRPEYKTFTQVGPLFSGDVLGDGFAAGVRKQDEELKKMLDEAVAAALADGTIKRLSEKWLKSDMTPKS